MCDILSLPFDNSQSTAIGQHYPTLTSLTLESLVRSVTELCKIDGGLRAIVDRHGHPPLWGRRPGYATLVRIILEQQVSLTSAKAVYRRIENALETVTVERMIETGEEGLRGLGVTRQKASYCVGVARAIESGDLNLRRVARASETEARAELQSIRGIGRWTADIYFLMALRRPDIWPTGDIALLTALRDLRGLHQRPSNEEAERVAQAWRPLRAVAARILWHGYLSRRT